MRTTATLLMLGIALTGCKGGGDDTGATGDTEEPFVASGEGHFVFIRIQESEFWEENALLGGFFADSRQGLLNPHECLLGSGVLYYDACITELPADPDSSVAVDADLFDADAASFAFNGLEVGVGSEVAHFVNDYSNGLRYYQNEPLPGTWGDDGSLSLTGGDWGEFAGTDDFVFPEALVAYEPDPLESFELTSGDTLPIEWAAGSGDVFMVVTGPGATRLYSLEDDGSFELDIDEVGLSESGWVSVILMRQAWNEVDINGASMLLQAADQQWFEGVFTKVDFGDRVLLVPSETCGGATAVGAGTYYGSIGSLANDSDPGDDGCTGWEASGPDGMVEITVGADQLLSVTYGISGGDASVYLLEDCADADSCLVGADSEIEDAEGLTWLNTTGAEVTVTLVLDSFDDLSAGTFLLDVEIVPFTELDAGEVCGDADALPALTAGNWFGDLDAAVDDYEPRDASCANGPTLSSSGDIVTRVELQPDERFEATVTRAESVALMMLTDCADLGTCVAGDAEVGSDADISWHNAGTEVATYYLVIDGTGTFQLEASISSVTTIAAADDCAGAGALTALGEGRYFGNLDGFTDTINPTATGCTGFEADGGEGIVKVEVPAGQRLVAEVEMNGFDPSVYLLTDCADTGTCVAGVDASPANGETLTYRNTSSSTEELFLVIDAYGQTGAFSLEIGYEATTALAAPDTCGEAELADSVGVGLYTGVLDGYSNDLDPGASGCTGYNADAGEGIVPIDVEAGQTLTLGFSLESGDAALYILEDCSDAETCIVGVDSVGPPGHTETLSWTNTSAFTETVYAALDGYGSAGPYTLSVELD